MPPTDHRGIRDLMDAAKGRPGVVVSAGPSLARNVDLLRGEESRFVIVATQTVLKTLLAKGIRPHFVCALDWSDISRRFYEGLTREAVEGVHLVVTPTVNPAVPEAWPGVLRMTWDAIADMLIGEDRSQTQGSLPPAATVAQMCYNLCRYLGCDPVILIGQDLGFTDGQYYAKGAAIHDVWSGELNEFNTLEMLEWQRIARGRHANVKVKDIHGRSMYTDVQMATYLHNFEVQFRADQEKGLTTVDATEGGARKDATAVMTLREAMDRYRPGTDLDLTRERSWRFVDLATETRKHALMQRAGR